MPPDLTISSLRRRYLCDLTLNPQLVERDAPSIDCEVWEMPARQFGNFVEGIAAPLGIGKLELADGGMVSGFIRQATGMADARDITAYGGWRAWLKA